MEHIEAILHHKIQESDFTNMYGIKKPSGGGGQTYIQAAGYSREELEKMFNDANDIVETYEFWDNDQLLPRYKYTIIANVVGSNSSASIELAPRTGRKDYRISRQNMKYRHPAWHPDNGFPEPKVSGNGAYLFEKGYPSIIDNLHILIIKTRDDNDKCKYYATYVDSENIPEEWPKGAGLEEIFLKSKKQGIIFFDEQYIRFENDKICPFKSGSAADTDIGNISLPEDFYEIADDAVEYSNKDVSIKLDYDKVCLEEVAPPASKARKKISSQKKISKDVDYERRHKNLKNIGDIGEELTMEIEKKRLIGEGRSDLAKQIERVSKTIGDGLGYDIRSYELSDGQYVEKYIEVKTTTGGKNKPFDISSNEVEISAEKGDRYCLYRFYGVSSSAKTIRYYVVRGSVTDNFVLEPTAYKAYYKK